MVSDKRIGISFNDEETTLTETVRSIYQDATLEINLPIHSLQSDLILIFIGKALILTAIFLFYFRAKSVISGIKIILC